ncbi:hypothetical protein K3495_g1465 [Podosphaera aphanis]|nr:hypothetical protein K3495_g1465 [Podosphaera aphanis]
MNENVGHDLSGSEIYQEIHNQQNIDEVEIEMTEDQEDPLSFRRYNIRDANAKPSRKPSRKQAENESVRGPNASKYGAYPIAYAAQYVAGTDLKMDPQSYEEAMSRTEADKWRTAIHKEYNQLYDKQTWTLQKRSAVPPEFRPLTGKLVVRGFEQRNGIVYDKTFASTCASTTWKLAIALAAKYGYEIHQMDVVAAFLHGDIEGQVYVEMPPMWKETIGLTHDGDFCKLSKSLYGLKQSPRLWQKKLREVLRRLNYKPLPSDEAAYVNTNSNNFLAIITHVDDFLIIAKSGEELKKFNEEISKELNIEDLGYACALLSRCAHSPKI